MINILTLVALWCGQPTIPEGWNNNHVNTSYKRTAKSVNDCREWLTKCLRDNGLPKAQLKCMEHEKL